MAINKTGDTGIRKAIVPDLSGMNRTQYQAALTALGLTYTETAQNTSDSNLDQKFFSQGTAAGTTVIIGSSVTMVYYNYVYPGFSHYGSFGHYGGFGHYAGFGHYGSFAHYGSFRHFFAYGLNATEAPWGGVLNSILTPGGFTVSSELMINDKLVTVLSDELNKDLKTSDWFVSELNNVLNSEETSISSVVEEVVEELIVINGSLHFAKQQSVLAKKGELISFVKFENLDESYQLYSALNKDWMDIARLERMSFIDKVNMVKCEPYNWYIADGLVVNSGE